MADAHSTAVSSNGKPLPTKTEIFWLALHPEAEEYRARFWSKVDKRGPDECWEWTAGYYSKGYGAFKCKSFGNNVMAHRISFLFANGFLPLGNHVHVRHKCNN